MNVDTAVANIRRYVNSTEKQLIDDENYEGTIISDYWDAMYHLRDYPNLRSEMEDLVRRGDERREAISSVERYFIKTEYYIQWLESKLQIRDIRDTEGWVSQLASLKPKYEEGLSDLAHMEIK